MVMKAKTFKMSYRIKFKVVEQVFVIKFGIKEKYGSIR